MLFKPQGTEHTGTQIAFSVPLTASDGSTTIPAATTSVNSCNISEASGGAEGFPPTQILPCFLQHGRI